ncbi:MAG TPA: glycosyltransferase [Steroidobacteraceae bacterium]|nr:glycosyltransferase [Steroidobacteraceae bacterium]
MSPAIQQPLVSVILPTFGRLEYLRQTVDSVYRQTSGDWELIIADDGSDEETRAYLRTLAGDRRIKLVWLAHTGIPAIVRNAALREARGRYVAFLDSDDLWVPQKLARQVEMLRARPLCAWSYTAVAHVDGGGQPLSTSLFGPWLPAEGAVFERLVTGPPLIRTPSVIAARDLIARAGAFDETIRSGEDYDLWLRLALASEVALLDEPLVQVRRHEANHTSRDWEIAFSGRDRTLKKLQSTVDGDRRVLLRSARIHNALTLAGLHASLGNRARMFRALYRALPFAWRSPQWWLALVRTPLRPYVPQRLVDAYRRRRRAAAL